MPGHRRLAISRLRVPNLDGFVVTAAGNLFSIGAPRHRIDPGITRSQHTNQQKQRFKLEIKITWKKKLPARVPGQRRLAISRLRVPNLDGAVMTAAGNLFSIGAPRHWFDPEIARSQHTNQHKKRREKIGKTYHSEWPVNWQSRDRELTGHSQSYTLKSFTCISFSSMHLSTKGSLFE